MIPVDVADREALAGEYVLGTLDARQARVVEHAMRTDEAMRAAVTAWQARFAPLTEFATPEVPPPGLWERIEASLAPAPAAASAPAARPSGFWRAGAIGAFLAAAGLAAALLMRPAPGPRMTAVLLPQGDQQAWVVEADGAALRLAAANPQPVLADHVMQLWAAPQGATAPASLGLIPAGEARLTLAPAAVRPEPGMLIEITLEPPGGSPTGGPRGPVVFTGRLAAATGP